MRVFLPWKKSTTANTPSSSSDLQQSSSTPLVASKASKPDLARITAVVDENQKDIATSTLASASAFEAAGFKESKGKLKSKLSQAGSTPAAVIDHQGVLALLVPTETVKRSLHSSKNFAASTTFEKKQKLSSKPKAEGEVLGSAFGSKESSSKKSASTSAASSQSPTLTGAFKFKARSSLEEATTTASNKKSARKDFSVTNSKKETGTVSSLQAVVTEQHHRARKRRSSPTARDSSSPSLSDTKLPSSTSTNSGSSKKARNRSLFDQKKPAALKKESFGNSLNNSNSIMAGGGRRNLPAPPSDYRAYNNQNSSTYYVDNRDEETPNENDPASARGDHNVAPSNSPSMVVPENEDIYNDPEIISTFKITLKKRGLEIVEQEGDGNCLFRAVSLQVYGDASMHGEVRHKCLDFMAKDEAHFAQFITDEPFQEYIRRKRLDGVHGNNPEIQAISELFNRPVEVFVPENGAAPLNIFHSQYKTEDTPIRLSYHDGNHYNAVVDPLVPTAGLGLGLPGLQPGLADKMQVAKAVAESDKLADQMEYERVLEESQNDQLQRAIKESSYSIDTMYQNKAIALSDLDATNFELEQAVLESSLDSFRAQEHGRKQRASSSSNVGTADRRRPPNEASSSSRSGVASIPQANTASFPSAATAAASTSSSSAAATSRISSQHAASSSVARIDERRENELSSQYHQSLGGASIETYPETINELVMNGFELQKVIHAYELIGDNFDNLLAFLMSTSSAR